MTDFNIDIPEIHFPDTIELDDDIDFSVADFSLVDEEEQTRIIKPKMAKSANWYDVSFCHDCRSGWHQSSEEGKADCCI